MALQSRPLSDGLGEVAAPSSRFADPQRLHPSVLAALIVASLYRVQKVVVVVRLILAEVREVAC